MLGFQLSATIPDLCHAEDRNQGLVYVDQNFPTELQLQQLQGELRDLPKLALCFKDFQAQDEAILQRNIDTTATSPEYCWV